MVHARNVKPPFAGAWLTGIDESSVKNMPGFVKVVSKGNYVAVVCEREEQAINASRRLKATWERPATAPFRHRKICFTYMRGATPTAVSNLITVGNPDAGVRGRGKDYRSRLRHSVSGTHRVQPGPRHGRPPFEWFDDDLFERYEVLWNANGRRHFLGMPREKVRVIWMEGPQGFGRTAADDAGFEAAYIAKEIGRPVRMQWMRDEETAWDTKAPAFTVKVRGGLDAAGNLVAYEYHARAADHNHVGYNEPDTVLIAQLMGSRRAKPASGSSEVPAEMYAIPNRRMSRDVVSLPLVWETPVRTGNLRDPNGPQSTFAAESFIDELAAAAKADPVEFRMKLLQPAQRTMPGSNGPGPLQW